MYTHRKVLYVVISLIILKSNSQSRGYCGTRQPVIRICTEEKLTNEESVNIDTDKVPRFQAITCKCIISTPSIVDLQLEIIGETDVKHIHFKLNKTMPDSTSRTTATFYDKTDLWLVNTSNATSPNICLMLRTDFSAGNVRFDITCLANTNQSTTTTVRPHLSDSTSTVTGDTKPQMNPERTKTSDLDIIIPVVAATAGVVCLSCVVVVIVVCRRRSRKNQQESDTTVSETVAGKETEDDYYMTENPMYNMTETEPKMQRAESEYHYIEPDHKGDRKSSNQYESPPDSPVSKQFQNKQSNHDLHYDYTTCLSASDKNGTVVNNKISKKNGENKGGGRSILVNQPITGELMYDHTGTVMPKQFLSVNEYHHLSPAASSKNVTVDIYNTAGHVKNKHTDDEENDEDSDYNVTNLR